MYSLPSTSQSRAPDARAKYSGYGSYHLPFPCTPPGASSRAISWNFADWLLSDIVPLSMVMAVSCLSTCLLPPSRTRRDLPTASPPGPSAILAPHSWTSASTHSPEPGRSLPLPGRHAKRIVSLHHTRHMGRRDALDARHSRQALRHELVHVLERPETRADKDVEPPRTRPQEEDLRHLRQLLGCALQVPQVDMHHQNGVVLVADLQRISPCPDLNHLLPDQALDPLANGALCDCQMPRHLHRRSASIVLEQGDDLRIQIVQHDAFRTIGGHRVRIYCSNSVLLSRTRILTRRRRRGGHGSLYHARGASRLAFNSDDTRKEDRLDGRRRSSLPRGDAPEARLHAGDAPGAGLRRSRLAEEVHRLPRGHVHQSAVARSQDQGAVTDRGRDRAPRRCRADSSSHPDRAQ